ncbi:heparinase II/III domain-containing protein [Corynebacterium lubricantis]|uniref:heparinase II/III domain-containing protein n=1 Tax=Corynebacterium lubricantis TaxID=541095 RepID=UPI0014614A6D|nr:heparinase II/III family protein [Corynebacterium lubricantis]
MALKNVRHYFETGDLQLDPASSAAYDNGEFWSSQVPRSLGRKTHGWFFIRDWGAAWNLLDESETRTLATEFNRMFETWCLEYRNSTSTMAYHDETTAQRVINFVVFFHSVMASSSLFKIDEYLEFIKDEVNLLASSEFYAGKNNHGMFQNIAILVAEAYGITTSNSLETHSVAVNRLIQYFNECFDEDGIHQENTPTYHLMVSRYLGQVVQYLESIGETTNLAHLKEIKAKADHYGAFALTPRNHFVPVSDTKLGVISESQVRSVFGENTMMAAHSFGRISAPPASKTFVSTTSGYGVYRSDWTPQAEYLFFSAAYNADYHKHSDEMSVYYFANGRELISEAGPNGYEYSDPLTKYGFSSAAHNTLLVDDQGLPRVDDGQAATNLVDIDSTPDTLDVKGATTRYPGVEWSRRVFKGHSAPGQVEIFDSVRSQNERKYTFLWHIPEDTTPILRGNGLEIFDRSDDQKLGELTWFDATPTQVRHVIGQRHPYVQGWTFPTMGEAKAASAIEVVFSANSLDIRWDLRSENFKLLDRGITPQSNWQTYFAEKPVNYLFEYFGDDEQIKELAIVFTAVGQKYDFTYNYRASMKKFKGAVVYILDDFGDQGSYYLASNRNMAEFRSVQSLIKQLVHDLNLTFNDVISIGTAKGGSAALLHGVTLGIRQVLVGAPQYKIGSFLKNPHPNILRYIAGGTTDADVSWLNQTAFTLLQSGTRTTKVSILVGKGDHHYRDHVVPLVDDLHMLGYAPELLLLPGTTHSELGGVFRGFLENLNNSIGSDSSVLPNAISSDAKTKSVGVAVAKEPETRVWAQLISGKERLGKLVSVKDGTASWSELESGIYRVRIYFERETGGERKAFGTRAVRL